MKRQMLKKMKTYTRMPSDENIPRKKLPKVVQKRLDEYLKAGLIKQTRNGFFMKTDEEVKETEKPEWVEAAEEAVAPEEPQQEAAAPAVTQFGLVLGNRAASIVQLCDALQNGTAGLTALGDIRGQAMMILYDLNLLAPAPVEEADSQESS